MTIPSFATPEERAIDMHYQSQMTAENTKEISDQQAAFFQRAEERAREVVSRLDRSNHLLSALVGGMERLHDVVQEQTEVLVGGFQEIAAQLYQQQQQLEEIAHILRQPLETQALELLTRADRALKDGMRASGRDQEEWFKDAFGLLEEVLKNPMGKTKHYVAWFQSGWLFWKYKNDFPSAEESFYQAARISSPEANLYYVNSLRHQAYMQYFQGHYVNAYNTIHKALALPVVNNDHDVMYETARYAARIGRDDDALQLLDKCIDLQPQTIIVMFSEEDFIL